MRQLEAWVTRCFDHPLNTLLGLLGITVVAGLFGAGNFQLNSSMDDVIAPRSSDQWFSDDEALKAAFPQLRDLAIVVVSGTSAPEVSRATDQLLAARPANIARDQLATPMRESAIREAIAFYLNSDDFSNLIDSVALLTTLSTTLHDVGALTGALGILARELPETAPPLLLDLLQGQETSLDDLAALSDSPSAVEGSDGLFYELVLVNILPDYAEQFPTADIVSRLEAWILPIAEIHTGLSIDITGDVVLANEEISDALGGVKLAAALSTVFLVLVVALGVRSWVLTLGMVSLVAIGSLWTHALAMITVGQYNTLSLAFLVMFFGLGVDFGLHYGLAVREASPHSNAVGQAVRNTGVALLLSAMTTALAFLSFTPTEYRGLGELGVISAGGMLVAIFLTLTLLPALFGWLGLPDQGTAGSSEWKIKWPSVRVALVLWVILGIAGALKARDASFDYSVAGLRDLDTPAMTLLEQLQRAGFSTDYSISTLVEPSIIPDLKPALLALDAVGYVASIEDFLPDIGALNREERLSELRLALDRLADFPPLEPAMVRAQLAGLDRQPSLAADVRELVTELATYDDQKLLDLDQNMRQALSGWRGELAPLLSSTAPQLADLSPELRGRWIMPDGRYRLEIGPALPTHNREGLDYFVNEVRRVVDNGGGRAVIEHGVGGVVVRAFTEASLLALVGIAALLALYYRGFVMPVVVIIPLGLTTVLTFAVMEIIGLSLNMANVLVVPLIFGLGIDSAIHVAHRYQTLGSMERLMRSSTPRAVLLSAVTTVATFASLMTSAHRGAASLGQLLTIAIPIMVLVTFSLVPVLMEYLKHFLPRPTNS